MNRRSFLSSFLGAAAIAVAQRLCPAALATAAVEKPLVAESADDQVWLQIPAGTGDMKIVSGGKVVGLVSGPAQARYLSIALVNGQFMPTWSDDPRGPFRA